MVRRVAPILAVVLMLSLLAPALTPLSPETGGNEIASAGSVPCSPTRTRDPTPVLHSFTSPSAVAGIAGLTGKLGLDDEESLDLSPGYPLLELLGNDTLFPLELHLNDSTTEHLFMQAYRWNGASDLRSSEAHYLDIDSVKNASLVVAEWYGPGLHVAFVCGTHVPAGAHVGFMQLYVFNDLDLSPTLNDSEQEVTIGGQETVIQDVVLADLDQSGPTAVKVIMTGSVWNVSKWDAALWVVNITLAAGIQVEYELTWSSDVADLRPLALDAGDLTGDTVPDVAVVGLSIASGTAYGRQDDFSGTGYAPNSGEWARPNYTYIPGAPSTYFDCLIANLDADPALEVVTVGSLTTHAAVSTWNWTGAAPQQESYYLDLPTGNNSKVYLEVASANHSSWSDGTVVLSGVSTDGVNEYHTLELWEYTGQTETAFPPTLPRLAWSSISNASLGQAQSLLPTQELQVGDMDADGEGEVWLSLPYVESATVKRQVVVFGVAFSADAPEVVPDDDDDGGGGGGTTTTTATDGDDDGEEEPRQGFWAWLGEWLYESGWNIVLTSLWGAVLFALFLLRGWWSPKSTLTPRGALTLAALVAASLIFWPGIPTWDISGRSFVWWRVSGVWERLSYAIGTLIP